MSVNVQYGLIAHFFNLKWDEIDFLPITQFQNMLSQAINIASLYAGGKFETETTEDKENALRKEIQAAKEFQEAIKGK